MDAQKEERLQETEEMQMSEQEECKRPKMSKVTYYALIGIFAAVFVLSGIYLAGYFLETGAAQQDYDALASIYQEGAGTTRPSATNPPSSAPTETQPPVMLQELQPIYELNNELVGYLSFPYDDLRLSYPVMQSLWDSDYYLDHDFYKEESIAGCPYVPDDCDVFEPSDKVIIYSHNLRTGGMFNKLTKYKDKSYWESHQTFYFDTLYERHTYQVFAVFKTAGKQFTSDGKVWGYPFHRVNDFQTEEEFDQFIADVKGAAFKSGGYKGQTFYDTGITPQYGDKLLCLTTCEYTMKDPDGTINGRFVILAVRVS